ncbi:MAG TPA: hypothetical protein VHX66_08085 [Solirubrobacteraceae bacterium]|jgi:thiazole synthase ThiGH ThiG subunit|nr:hypothetical protein [Solirubrobacteraceae bacterium]
MITSHLQEAVDAAMAEQILPLGEAIEDAVGPLDDEQRRVVAAGLQQVLIAGLRIGFGEAVAQAVEQGVDAHLVLALEADPPPPQ